MRERETREKQTKRKRTAGVVLSSVLVFSDFLSSVFFIFPENHSNSSFYLHGTFLHLYRGALLFSTILFERRTPLLLCPSAKKCSRSISSRAFCEFLRSRRVFSGAISRDKSDGRRINILREREKKKAILAAVSNFESDDRAIVPAKSARVQIRDDFLIHAFASRMICARFSSLHIRVVVPGGAREVNREKSKNLISQRER